MSVLLPVQRKNHRAAIQHSTWWGDFHVLSSKTCYRYKLVLAIGDSFIWSKMDLTVILCLATHDCSKHIYSVNKNRHHKCWTKPFCYHIDYAVGKNAGILFFRCSNCTSWLAFFNVFPAYNAHPITRWKWWESPYHPLILHHVLPSLH